MKRMLEHVNNVWALLSVERAFIIVDGQWFRTRQSDVLEPVNNFCIGLVLEDGQIKLLYVPNIIIKYMRRSNIAH